MNTNIKDSEVYKYLEYLEMYLTGDLETFHRICKEYEELEKQDSEGGNNVLTISNSAGGSSTLLSYPQTTIRPEDEDKDQFYNTVRYFRSTIPHALTLFSTMEMLGYLLRDGEQYWKSEKNFNSFIENNAIEISQIEKKVLHAIYRNGMSHNYFPKLNMGIAYHSTNHDKQLFYLDEKGNVVLNVNFLETIVLKTITAVRENEAFYPKMEGKYLNLIGNYQAESQDLIDELKSKYVKE